MLEPTTRYGYKNLQTVRNVVEMFEINRTWATINLTSN